MNKVFVYGTLRQNESNHHYLEKEKLLASQCWVKGELYDTGYGYPALVNRSDSRVYGELYQIGDKKLEAIDLLEEYYGEGQDNDYERMTKTVYTDKGEERALVYYFPFSKVDLNLKISSGDWKNHRLLKKNDLLYFAYGSCMDRERFKESKVDHLFEDILGKGVLEGFALQYTRKAKDGGRADIVEVGGFVEGKLYRIGQEALNYLYKREGVNASIYRPTFVNLKLEGKILPDVLTFTVANKNKEITPPPHYFQEIIRGGKGFLSEKYLEKLREQYEKLKNEDEYDEF